MCVNGIQYRKEKEQQQCQHLENIWKSMSMSM
jgi:hypothetical protein